MIDLNKNLEEENIQKAKDVKISIRDELRNLIKRYHNLLGFNVRDKEDILEIYEPKSDYPLFKFVFDRKSSLKFPDADLITFGSKKLIDIINLINDKGKIAKAYIPFKFEPEESFSSSIKKLILKSNSSNNKYILNGEIESLGHYISYIPFLVLIFKIEFLSLESFVIIEKSVIPLISSTNKVKIDENFYVQKIINYFNLEHPNLTSSMPIEGEIIDIDKKEFEELLTKTVKKIESSLEDQKGKIKERMNERLKKELDILENYYNQRMFEIKNQIESAKGKDKKEFQKELKPEIVKLEEERQFKNNEYITLYQVQTNYNIIGAALIYIPAVFYFKCKITTPYGIINKNLEYDIFENEIIPPKCICGKSIYQAIGCENLHLTCLDCSFHCSECNKLICKLCDMEFCKKCNAPLCNKHAYVCTHCKEIGSEKILICKNDLNQCNHCNTNLCPDCSEVCCICEKIICKFNKECSRECPICNKYACIDHTFNCMFDNKIYCLKESHDCSLCHQTYCITHFTNSNICKTCMESSIEKFYKFLKYKNGKLQLPLELNNSNDNTIVKKRVGRTVYSVPRNQSNIKMGENRNFYIFIIKKLTKTITIVHNKKDNTERIYEEPSFLGNLISQFNRKNYRKEIELETPVMNYETDVSKKKSTQGKDFHKCSNCNKVIKEEYKICPYCGNELKK